MYHSIYTLIIRCFLVGHSLQEKLHTTVLGQDPEGLYRQELDLIGFCAKPTPLLLYIEHQGQTK